MSAGVRHSGFYTDERVLGLCRDDRCSWKKVLSTLGGISAAARKHVEETGHEVQISRSQWKIVRPAR
jgi:hypothetical protein